MRTIKQSAVGLGANATEKDLERFLLFANIFAEQEVLDIRFEAGNDIDVETQYIHLSNEERELIEEVFSGWNEAETLNRIEQSADTWIERDGDRVIFHGGTSGERQYEVSLTEWYEAVIAPESLTYLEERL